MAEVGGCPVKTESVSAIGLNWADIRETSLLQRMGGIESCDWLLYFLNFGFDFGSQGPY